MVGASRLFFFLAFLWCHLMPIRSLSPQRVSKKTLTFRLRRRKYISVKRSIFLCHSVLSIQWACTEYFMCDEMSPKQNRRSHVSTAESVFSPTLRQKPGSTQCLISTVIFITQMGQLYGGARVQFSQIHCMISKHRILAPVSVGLMIQMSLRICMCSTKL